MTCGVLLRTVSAHAYLVLSGFRASALRLSKPVPSERKLYRVTKRSSLRAHAGGDYLTLHTWPLAIYPGSVANTLCAILST